MSGEIDDIMKAFVKAVKAIQMYGVEHPYAKNFYKPLYEKVTDYLKMYAELNLQIEQFKMLSSDQVVYEETEKDVSIAFKLFRDGVRNVGFTEGLSLDELLIFLETVSKSSKDEDVALLLWECDFTHIHFYVIEEEETADYRVPEAKQEKIDYEAKMHEIAAREKVDLYAAIDPELVPKEFEDLKEEILLTEKMLVTPTAITTLINFLRVEPSKDIVDGLIELLERCIDSRDFYNARRIIHHLEEIVGVNPIDRFENENTIMGFTDLVSTAPKDVFNEFIAFIGFFSKKSIPYFLNVMTYITNKDRLLALRNRVASIAENDIRLFTPFLNSDDVTVLTHAIAMLGLIKSKDVIRVLQPLMQHPNAAVRSELISVYTDLENPVLIAHFLDDASSHVRIKALQAITAIKYKSVYPELLQRIRNKGFLNLDFEEQQEYFNCLVTISDSDITKYLKKILFKQLFWGRKRYRVMRTLAAQSLVYLGTDDALEILRTGIKKRNRDVASACRIALEEK